VFKLVVTRDRRSPKDFLVMQNGLLHCAFGPAVVSRQLRARTRLAVRPLVPSRESALQDARALRQRACALPIVTARA
jgi:hypothetical protein